MSARVEKGGTFIFRRTRRYFAVAVFLPFSLSLEGGDLIVGKDDFLSVTRFVAMGVDTLYARFLPAATARRFLFTVWCQGL